MLSHHSYNIIFQLKVIYPKIWHPTKAIITTASQYMVAAVSLERYIVICHKSVASPKQIYYTLWVVTFSVIVNLPRFCEFEGYASSEDMQLESNGEQLNLTGAVEDLDKKDKPFSLSYQTSKLGENSEWILFMACHEISLIIFCSIVISFCNHGVFIQVLNSSEMTKCR